MKYTEEDLIVIRKNIIDFIRWGGFDTDEPSECLADEYVDSLNSMDNDL